MSVFKIYVSLEQESINIIFSFKKGKFKKEILKNFMLNLYCEKIIQKYKHLKMIE